MSKARDFTEKHRAACARAWAETGKSHREIAQIAGAEGLYGIEFPREPSVSTVQGWCERKVSVESIRRRLLTALDAWVTLELPNRKDERYVSGISQALRSLEKAERGQARGTQPPKPQETEAESTEPERSETMERLLSEQRQNGDGNGGRVITQADEGEAARTREVLAG